MELGVGAHQVGVGFNESNKRGRRQTQKAVPLDRVSGNLPQEPETACPIVERHATFADCPTHAWSDVIAQTLANARQAMAHLNSLRFQQGRLSNPR